MNPDGTALDQRYNAEGYDMNRAFPDQFVDAVNTTEGRPTEVGHVMNWVLDRRPIISLNYHGGALVANYPFDNNPQNQSVESPTPDPDDAALIYLAESYTVHNTPMWTSSSFYHGITNGAAWYAIHGGMQDWFYVWSGGWDTTLEVSVTKWPAGSTLPGYWDDNRESMLSYFEGSLLGVRGIVTDAETGLPLDAEIYIDDNPWPSYTDPDVGDYHRVVVPGAYTLEATALGYGTQTVAAEVYGGAADVYDFVLIPLPTTLQYDSSAIDDGAGGDGYIDPGESADLAVTVRNLGRSATSLSAELVPTGWFATVTRKDAGYPDLAVGESGESVAPHYAIDIDSSAPDGHKVGFALRWSSADESGTTNPFFLDVGGPACHGEPSEDTPQSINDYSYTYSQVIFPEPVTIAEVKVPVDISHTYIGDLLIELLSPSGTRVALHNRSGGSANDIVGTYGEELTPAESLDAFIGEQANLGAWQMDIYDAAGGDTGMLNSWSLIICGQQPEEATPEMRFDDLEVEPDGVMLRWWPYPGLTNYKVYRATDPSAVENFVDVTTEDGDDTDTQFKDTSAGDLTFYIVTGVGPQGEGPKGHFGE
jgi:subtilisin-like proprotein convertase family protein